MTKDDQRLAPEMRIFLSQAYNLKAIADYETGPDAEVGSQRAAQAVEGAKLFVVQVISLIETF
ncbi:hypothetical protein [Nitrospirillum amazonense]|uniref:hypothetical protein n=1 Tax=Nitrospirillum amazonense TaxID=28077 RepID=UPI001FEB6D5C|nr:hypothetical protein [Nitrospirillum amazonense]MDG3444029.1 hypothetical protein [Nitrospirillum amazonense]